MYFLFFHKGTVVQSMNQFIRKCISVLLFPTIFLTNAAALEVVGVPTKFIKDYVKKKDIDSLLLVVEDNTTSKYTVSNLP